MTCWLYTFIYFFFFFNDTATTEIYTRSIVGSVRCVQETGINAEYMGIMEMKGTQWVVKDTEREDYYWPSEALKKHAWVSDKGIYEQAAKDSLAWWEKMAKEGISWFSKWKDIYKEDAEGNISWFLGGKMNLSYNIVCLLYTSPSPRDLSTSRMPSSA
eukprot:TRINITY_DN7886_c0_g1_i1.p1 TRINITY_DN7886_c0_g1~~TRINITY_DN7886_c0_g1_i1.p1  ORF type:complete len:158 (-),score=48.04 TRINITY_DN7886_c0_g1_i1:102-575(-)